MLAIYILLLKFLNLSNSFSFFNVNFIMYLTLLPILIAIFSIISTLLSKSYLTGIASSTIPLLFISNSISDSFLILYSIFGIFSSFIFYFFIKSKNKIFLGKFENPIPLAIAAVALSLILIVNYFNYRFLLAYFLISLISSFLSSTEQKFFRSSLLGILSSLGPIGFFIISWYLVERPIYIRDCNGLELSNKILMSSIGNRDLACAEGKAKIKLERPFILWIYGKYNPVKLKNYIEIGISEKPSCKESNCIDLSDKDLYHSINFLNNLSNELKGEKDLLIKLNMEMLSNADLINVLKKLSKRISLVIEMKDFIDKDFMQKFNAASSGVVFCCVEDPEKSLNIAKVFFRYPYELAEILKQNALVYPSCDNGFLVLRI